MQFISGNHALSITLKLSETFDRDGNSNKEYVWELDVALDGKHTLRRIDGDDETADDDAYRSLHRAVAEHQGTGFVLAVDGLAVEPQTATFTDFADLERAIDAAPDDGDAWQALADAWAAIADPRGACVLLERTLQNITDPAVFVKNRKATEAARRVRTGVIYQPLGTDGYRVRTTFKRGLVDQVAFEYERHAPGRPTHELLASVLANPFARFVRELEISAEHRVVETLAHLAPRSLRTLRLNDHADPTPLDLGRLSGTLPALETFRLVGGEHTKPIEWATLDLPQLTTLSLNALVTLPQLESILTWITHQPRLTTVELNTETHDPAMRELAKRWSAERGNWPGSLSRFTYNHDSSAR